ncbi:Hypothetical predicted protein [Pelobates cultripes]|uniref:Uncharacterized protein n=1 Tax=Pelobates cultripes TaxID=61616 RepID=A0AAD1SVJ1_PELCU|nr:Hypothetical predicted protein [Pelobates cultripes]
MVENISIWGAITFLVSTTPAVRPGVSFLPQNRALSVFDSSILRPLGRSTKRWKAGGEGTEKNRKAEKHRGKGNGGERENGKRNRLRQQWGNTLKEGIGHSREEKKKKKRAARGLMGEEYASTQPVLRETLLLLVECVEAAGEILDPVWTPCYPTVAERAGTKGSWSQKQS